MPPTPEEFFVDFETPRLPPVRRPQLLEWLSVAPMQAAVAGYRVDTRDALLRLAVLANFVFAVATLHRHGMVYGDLSLASAAFSASDARVHLLDCHAAAALTDPGRHQDNTPHFLAPECRAVGVDEHARGNPHLQDQQTDVYKLGLCIVRGLSQGRGSTQLRTAEHLADVLDTEMMAAVNGALSPDPGARPSARVLYSQLARYIERLTEPPEIAQFGALSTAVPRGSDLMFTWEVRNATAAYLRGPNGFSMPVDPNWGYLALPVTHSGDFALEASRRGATTVRRSAFITVFDLPEFDVADVAGRIVEIPTLEPISLGTILNDVPHRPTVEIGADFIPSVTIPPIATLTTAIATMNHRMGESFSVAEAVETLTGADVGGLTLPTIDALRFDVTDVGMAAASESQRAHGEETPA
ncbi:hypothetical protein [Microbacterium sp. CFBP9034]|uniref:hypothetical protein n=1 Tax=Microbacterium sp. CFBP9034 TaxID=3096540 RepID=UPI002A6AED73|nr:hypothetical protein [Microbacterium sp. CFBP9034]MDY0910896.1 hypothetical protein [Microbacterium sp. CFBP9034]